MTILGFVPCSSTMGIAAVRDFRTISIGLCIGVSMGFTGLAVSSVELLGLSLTVAVVMSASGTAGRTVVSGDAEGSGVGGVGTEKGSSSSTGSVFTTLFLFLGDFFTGSASVVVDATVAFETTD